MAKRVRLGYQRRRDGHAKRAVARNTVPTYDADCPYCLRGLRHNTTQHEEALKRVYNASKGDW